MMEGWTRPLDISLLYHPEGMKELAFDIARERTKCFRFYNNGHIGNNGKFAQVPSNTLTESSPYGVPLCRLL